MSKRKGISAEDKRTRMLQLFFEKKEFFQLKELETIAPKEKGIISQSVQDVVKSLVDDGLVDSDKIGSSVIFWAYPSKSKFVKKRKLDEITEKVDEINKKLKGVQESLNSSKAGKESSSERFAILDHITDLELDETELLQKIKQDEGNNLEVLLKMEKDVKIAKEAANRWTDNIFAIKSWCKKNFNIEEETLNKQFEIPIELDYLE